MKSDFYGFPGNSPCVCVCVCVTLQMELILLCILDVSTEAHDLPALPPEYWDYRHVHYTQL
jgi:hypothetical protein